jgi:hypothetical protein
MVPNPSVNSCVGVAAAVESDGIVTAVDIPVSGFILCGN